MPAQCRGRRDAEDVIETARPTPVENFGAAIMAVGAQQDRSPSAMILRSIAIEVEQTSRLDAPDVVKSVE